MLAVITGASRGIGESYARQLAARGYALLLASRDAERLARVAGEIRAAHAVAVEEIVLDLAQADGAERLYADVRRRRTEPVTLLVNNAGFGLYGEFVDMPMPRIQEMLVLHLLTVTKLVRLFLPEMRERRKGAIINVASVAGLLPLPYLSLYAATKAFMMSLGAGLALEARKYGVVIQTCCPRRTARGPEKAEVYASARDFDEGRQSFFLRRLDSADKESLYPLHGHFLDGGRSGVFMVHDGKGIKEGDAYRIDQSVNMGVLFLRTTDSGLRAVLDVFAEENGNRPADGAGQPLAEYSCRWAEEGRLLY